MKKYLFLILFFSFFSSFSFASTKQVNWTSYGSGFSGVSVCGDPDRNCNAPPAGSILRQRVVIDLNSSCNGHDYHYKEFACEVAPNPCSENEDATVMDDGQVSCEPPPGNENPDDSCPSGMPKFNGSCQACFEYNADGSCKSDDQCPAGQTKQGTINGKAVCQPSCPSDQSFGFVNGAPGCYGGTPPPNPCSDGGAFGAVNGIYGCYGGGSNSGSNGSSGSNTSSGSGNGGSGDNGGTGGSNGSSGSGGSGGSGSGGDNGSGSNGGSGGSSGGGNSNSIGTPFLPSQNCLAGYHKDGNYCVSDGRGDCIVGYHEVVVSVSPFYPMCVPDNAQQSSSSASSTSQSSKSSSSKSSSNSSRTSSQQGGSGSGSGSSTGSGGNGGEEEEQGDCDPKSKNYLQCIAPQPNPMPDHTQTDSGAKTIDEVNANFQNRLRNSPVVSSFQNVKTVVSLSASQCPPFTIELFGKTIGTTIHCNLWAAMALALSPVMMAIWTIIAFRIFASA